MNLCPMLCRVKAYSGSGLPMDAKNTLLCVASVDSCRTGTYNELSKCLNMLKFISSPRFVPEFEKRKNHCNQNEIQKRTKSKKDNQQNRLELNRKNNRTTNSVAVSSSNIWIFDSCRQTTC